MKKMANQVRILPMSKKDPEFANATRHDVQRWISQIMPKRGYYYKSGMLVEEGTVVLFQYEGHIIGFGTIREDVRFSEPNDAGYCGIFYFYEDSVQVVEPVTKEEMKLIWATFKGFNQTKQNLDSKKIEQFYNLIKDRVVDGSKKYQWIDEVKEALKEIGGIGTLEKIYNQILYRNRMDFTKNKSWKARVRETIYSHSSDSDVYKGKEDVFMTYEGKGKGKGTWALRDAILEQVENDINVDTSQEESFYEGKKVTYYGTRYERNAKNRLKAISIHGTTCKVCGFDFEKVYGEHGKGYIEIHHIKPISTYEEEVEINPEEDLVPVCSNCHRMIHRKRDQVLSINDIKKLMKA